MRLAYRLVHASRFGKPETAGVFKLVSFFPCQGSILPLDFYRPLSWSGDSRKNDKRRDVRVIETVDQVGFQLLETTI